MNSIYRKGKHSGVAAIALAMLAAVVLLAATAIPAQAQTETVLYSFKGSPSGGPDGAYPLAGPLLVGTTLYGTTSQGGSAGNGTVWSVSTTTGKETVLYSFQGEPNDAWGPSGGLAYYKGSFYGTTTYGPTQPVGGPGTVFKISKSGKKYVETILHVFTDDPDGAYPNYVTPVFDKQGNLYGTTSQGGQQGGSGIVFKLAPDGTETVLYSFNLNNGGAYNPESGVTLDKKGNLYGTTASGGEYSYGVLYEITAAGQYKVLYNFTGGDDGYQPYSPPVLDKKGNLWGTSENGFGFYGTVYKFDPKTSQMTIVHTFTSGADGASPWAGALVFDKEGNLYATTAGGGNGDCGSGGTIYELAPERNETILHRFNCTPDGQQPLGGVVFDKLGNLYTTTAAGGATTNGAVIKVTPE
jgi:uncharacterized repeat protein (TIGR03803 family)